jgi:hypothetical protein
MRIIVSYTNAEGANNEWVCTEDRLDHIMKVCEEKGFKVISVEYLI